MRIRVCHSASLRLPTFLGRSLWALFLLLAGALRLANAASIGFVQQNSADPQSPQTTVSVPFTAAQVAGNLNVVVVGWNDSTAKVNSVTDSRGNVYALAAAPVVQTGTATQAIYYAKNIAGAAAGANTVTVTFTVAAAFPDIRIAEYSGLDTVNPLDVSAGAQGNSATSDSGLVTTTSANDLLVGANLVQTLTTAAGAGYTNRVITSPDGDILEDRVVTAAGSYNATASVSSGAWIMQMVAFKGVPDTTPPTAPSNLTVTSPMPIVQTTQGYINPTLLTTHTTAPFDSTGGDAIVVYASSHAGVTMTPSDSFNNTWITIAGPTNTTTGFDLRSQVWYAKNPIVGPNHTFTLNLSAAQSLVISIIVVRGSNASAPIDAISTIGSDGGTQTLNVSSPNITTTSSNDLLIGFAKSSVSETFTSGSGYTPQPAASSNFLDSETGLAAAPGSYNSTFTLSTAATWQAVVIAVKPLPTALTLSWTASTDPDSPVSNYFVERCQGSGCNNFAQVGSTAGTTYTDTALSASTSYSYRVRATDPSGNLSNYSNVVTTTTSSGGGGGASSVNVTSGSGQSATISTAFGAPLVATVTDAGNNPVSGVVVTFTAPGSGASGTFAGGVNTATTNASGVATSATFTANATAGGPYTVAATVAGVATPANFSLTNKAGAATKVAVTSGSGQSATISTAFGAPLVATVTDSGNNPVSGVVVTFTAPGSGASGTFAGGVNTATTNASGVATSATFTANSTAGGPYTVTATVAGVATPANFSLTNKAGAAAKVAVTSGSGQSATINTAFGAPLVATVTDAGNNPVSGVVVTFTAPNSGASGTFAGGVNTATTNASGVATSAAFTANSTAGGPYNVVAGAAGATSANFALTNTAGAAAKVAVTSGSGQSTPINTAFGAPLVATVTDAGNNPVSGVLVTFTAPGSGASGTFAGGVNTATTNASGVATSATFTANSTAGGPYNVVASATGATSANFSLTNLAAAPATIVVTSGSGQSATISTAFGAPLVATVTDSGSNPVSGVVVTFTAPNSGASGTFAGGVNTATTNASGVATSATFTANATAGGPYTVAATVAGVATPANFSLTNKAGAATKVAVTSGSGQSATISTAFGAPLVATVTDSGNNPVSGVVVTFTAPGSGASGAFAGGVNTATTNASGVATSATFTANSTAGGPYNVVASATGATSANFLLTNTAGAAASITATAGTPQSATVSTAFATQLQATAKDAGNNPVSGVVVTFTAPGSGASGTFAGGVNTATTNASGVATSATFTANSTAGGPYNVVASATGATSANFLLTNTAGAAASITATAGTPQSATVSTAFATQLQATAKDAGNNPVSGVVVTFTAPASGASGTFAGGVNTATTNASGVATSAIFTANATAGGPYNVTATVAGVATPANFSLTNNAATPPSLTTLSLTQGPVGASITITGSNFGINQGSSTVTFSNTQATPTAWSATSIDVTVPTGAITGNVVVTVNGLASNGLPFTVTPPPNIATISPTSGPIGTVVTINGTNFGPTVGTRASGVSFNGLVGRTTTWSDTQIVVPVPQGATTGSVVVSVGGVSSNGVAFTVTSAVANIAFVQRNSADPQTPQATVTVPYTAAQTAGNFNVVVVGWNDSTAAVSSVTDTNGNVYTLAAGPLVQSGIATQAIYYAKNIAAAAAGANTLTVKFNVAAAFPDIRIAEYTGIDPTNPVDVSVGAQGSSATSNSGTVATTNANDLLVGANLVQTATNGPGTGYTSRVITSPDGDILEDQVVTATGSYSATASVSSGAWIMQMVAFRAAGSAPPPPISVSVSPTSANVSTGAGTQNFTATVTNDVQSKGVTWSVSGTGCSGAACGSLTGVTATTATYNAPATVPTPNTVTVTATSVADNTKSAAATVTITTGTLAVTLSPKHGSITTSQTQQFTATVFNDPKNGGVTWQVDSNTGGNSTSGTISPSGLFTPGTQPGLHSITATSVTNASVSATVSFAVTNLAGVYTYHNDVQRTGQNLQEYALNTATVNSSTFGQLFSCPVDGYVYAQPLYVANLLIGGTTRNVVYVATEHDSVYAFDADSPSCIPLWNPTTTGKVSFLSTGVTTMPYTDIQPNATNDVFPEIGITSTPVIDPTTNTLYVEAKTKETVGSGCSTNSPCYVHRLHALDITTGAEKLGGPVVISATNFNSLTHFNRPALLLNNGTIYIGFGSHGDNCPWQGWLFGYNAANLAPAQAQQFVWASSDPKATCNGAALWEGGAGPAADASGNVYVVTGNGTYDGTKNFSESVMKLSSTGTILDWFTPFNRSTLDANDVDMGSSGVIILPDAVGSTAHPHLLLATGKIAILYLLDQTNMGKVTSGSNNDVQEVIPVPPPNTTQLDGGNYGVPAYWNGNLYTTGQSYPLSQFSIANGVISTTQTATSSNLFPPRGAVPAVSANGSTAGIVWVLDLSAWTGTGSAVLYAYDATNVATLLYSSPASGTGAAGGAVKFTVPTVANGKVYIGGQGTFVVFGLLPN